MAKTNMKKGKKQKPMEWKKREDKNDIIEDSGKLMRELSQLRGNISSLRWKLGKYKINHSSLNEGRDYFSVDNAIKILEGAPDDLMKISSTIETLHANLIS